MRLTQQQVAVAGRSGTAAGGSARLAAALPACRLRCRAFTAIGGSCQRASRSLAAPLRAAVDEAPTAAAPAPDAADEDDSDFVFNFSDSVKNNTYTESDVTAAIRFYVDGEGTAPPVDEDQVTNYFGKEDASYFDDIDNNEAYEADEFVVAGIPEAAPKQRRGGRKGVGAGDDGEGDDDDDFGKAREQSRFKALEEAMVAAAQMEEMGLDGADSEKQRTVVGPLVWDWMQDFEAAQSQAGAAAGSPAAAADADADDEQLEVLASQPIRTVSSMAAQLPTDDSLLENIRASAVEELDQEAKETLELLVDDFDLEGELKRVDGAAGGDLNLPESADPALDDIQALLDADVSIPEIDESALELDLADVGAIEEEVGGDAEESLQESEVQAYLQAVRGVEGGELTADEAAALFKGDGGVDGEVTLVDLSAVDAAGDAEAADDAAVLQLTADTQALVATPEGGDEADDQQQLATLAAEEDDNEEDDDDEVADAYRAEWASLRATLSEPAPVVTEDELNLVEQYIANGEDFLARTEERRALLAAKVAAGELSPALLEEEDFDQETEDVESDLLAPHQWEGPDLNEADYDDDEEENWVERIIDLTRVTKVVKGGKLMGFRCVAVVGNQNGLVGVGCQAGREVAIAVKRALVDAKKSVVQVPLVGSGTLPHRSEAKFHSARCVVLPASEGTGCIAGGSIRSVLELAGVKDCLAKRLGCRSPLNNARCAVKALQQMRTLTEVAKGRGVPLSQLLLPKN